MSFKIWWLFWFIGWVWFGRGIVVYFGLLWFWCLLAFCCCFCLFVWNRLALNSLCRRRWLWTSDLPTATSPWDCRSDPPHPGLCDATDWIQSFTPASFYQLSYILSPRNCQIKATGDYCFGLSSYTGPQKTRIQIKMESQMLVTDSMPPCWKQGTNPTFWGIRIRVHSGFKGNVSYKLLVPSCWCDW